jgi:hypothetical protein
VQDSWGNFIPLRVALVVFGVAYGALDTQEVGVNDTDATRAFAANRTQDGGGISQPSKKGFESLRMTAISGVEELKRPLDGGPSHREAARHRCAGVVPGCSGRHLRGCRQLVLR